MLPFLFPSFCLGVLIRIYTSVYITVAAVGFVGVKCLSVYQKMLVCLFLSTKNNHLKIIKAIQLSSTLSEVKLFYSINY